MIEWDDKYQTGVERLDEQHKLLFKYVNGLESALDDGDVGPELMTEMLNFFELYAKQHFGDEEECMNRHHCPIAKNNQQAHCRFIDYFDNLKEEIRAGNKSEDIFREVVDFVGQWIVQHICMIDTQLKPCIHNQSE